MKQISHGLGVGVYWMRSVEVVMDIVESRQFGRMRHLTIELARTMAREAMQTCQKTGWLYWGRLDLQGAEKWGFEPFREVKGEDDQSGEGGGMSVMAAQVPAQGGLVMPTPYPVPVGTAPVPTRWLVKGRIREGQGQWIA